MLAAGKGLRQPCSSVSTRFSVALPFLVLPQLCTGNNAMDGRIHSKISF
jgi:hypothetical protein